MLKLVSVLKLTNYRTKDLSVLSTICTVRKLEKIHPGIPGCIGKFRSKEIDLGPCESLKTD